MLKVVGSNLKNISHTLSKNLIYTNDLQTTNTTNTILTLPKTTDTSNMDEGTLVYNTTDNKIYGKSDSTAFYFASEKDVECDKQAIFY